MITAQSVGKFYGESDQRVCAVHNLDLSIGDGERVAIVGKSGSGKSTLLNLLAGLDRPSEGALTVGGRRLDAMTRTEMAHYRLKTVGVVFQAFQLIPQRTAIQNVELPMMLSRMRGGERRAQAAQWLRQVGLEHRAHHLPYALSGGEQQRVAIARALANQPQVVLADEPTGNLDTATAGEIVDLLLKLCDQSQVTFVLVTHDDELAHHMCGRKLTMADGELVE